MALKYVIVGLLMDKPMHGYRLKRALSPALSADRLVNDGVLYPLLTRMEREGLIRRLVVAGRGTPARHVFRPTTKGRREFAAWLHGSGSEKDEVSYDFFLGHPFLAKGLFFRRLSREALRAKLEEQGREARAKLHDFRRIRAGMVARAVDPFHVVLLDLGLAQQRAKDRWIRRLIAETDRHPERYWVSPRPAQPQEES